VFTLGLAAYFGWAPLQSVLNRHPSSPETRQIAPPHKQAVLNPPLTSSAPAAPALKQEDQTRPAATAPAATPAAKAEQPLQEKTAPARAIPAAQPDAEIRVEAVVEATSGVSLSSLAVKHYRKVNTTLLDYTLDLNPTIKDPNLILVNQKIKFPEITEATLIKPAPEGAFKIHLATFASRSSAAQYSRGVDLQGKTIETVPRPVSAGATWYRLFAGPYKSRQEAANALNDLKSRGLLPPLQSNRFR
jgi:septal ring-binding cell division protein DamX